MDTPWTRVEWGKQASFNPTPLSFDIPCPRSSRMSAYTLYSQTLELPVYILPLVVWVYVY